MDVSPGDFPPPESRGAAVEQVILACVVFFCTLYFGW